MADHETRMKGGFGTSQLWKEVWAGPAGILGGGLLVVTSLSVGFDITLASVAALFVFVGAVGIRRFQQEASNDVGRAGLLLAGLGTSLTVIGWWLWALGATSGVTIFVWGFFFGLHGGVLVIGVETNREDSLSRWSPLPLVVGGIFVLAGLSWMAGFSLGGSVVVALVLLGGFGWTALGYGLWSESRGAVPTENHDAANDGSSADDTEIEDNASDVAGTERFRVSGQVALPNEDPVDDVLVRAFDRDLRSVNELGETRSDDEGCYEIRYTTEDFRRAEKDSADLFVRAYNAVGSAVVESEVVYNADPEQVIDLEVESSALAASEYERLEAELRPILDGASLGTLSDEDIEFLARETAIDERREEFPAGEDSIRLLAEAAKLAAETSVKTETLYAIGRNELEASDGESAAFEDREGDLVALADTEDDTLRETITAAVEANVVPTELRDSIDGELRRLRDMNAVQRAGDSDDWKHRDVTVRLHDESTGEPLAGYTVELSDPEIADIVAADGHVTDRDGTVETSFPTPPAKSEAGPPMRRLELSVFDHRGGTLHRETISLDDGEVEVAVAVAPSVLDGAGETSDGDTRPTVGPPREGPDGETPDDTNQLRHLVDRETGRQLAERGYSTPSDVAGESPSEFARRVDGVLEPEDASRVRGQAAIQTAALDSLVTNELTNAATRDVLAGQATSRCDPGESAVTPGAYLAALQGYVGSYVTAPEPDENGDPTNERRPLEPEVLVELFHQPFDGLLAHDAAGDPARHVRLCVEILLAHFGEAALGALFEDPQSGFHDALVRYQSDAYDALLNQWGTSRTELLSATHDDEERDAVADRLGIEPHRVTSDEPGGDVHLHAGADQQSPEAITQRNLERIFGLPALTEFDDGSLAIRDPLSEVEPPAIRTWRLDHLRETWAERDHPTDVYARGERPVVDPDVIGPDDFRHPDVSDEFELWVKRRAWTDRQLATLRELVPDVDAIVDRMSDPLQYGADQVEGVWSDETDRAVLETLAAQLAEGDADEARDRVRTELQLEPDALVRLVELLEKHDAASRRSETETVTDREWREWVSILVGAQKSHVADVWVDEERALGDGDAQPGDLLDPLTFWESRREPERGEWSSWIDAAHEAEDRPYIDPERLDSDDLPETTASGVPRTLYESRMAQLDEFRATLEGTYREASTGGADDPFDPVLDAVYEGPPDDGPFQADGWGELFEELSAALDEGDPEAEEVLRTTLHLSRDDFELLASIRRRTAVDFDGDPPSEQVLADGFDGLTSAWKRRTSYPDWIDAERDAGIAAYWRALKAKLPPWRASRGVRDDWQEALRVRSRAPIVDPDVVRTEDYLVGEDTAAFDLWTDRRARLATVADSLELGSGGDDAEAFEAALEETVGLTRESMRTLAERRERGESVSARLAQLHLSGAAFSTLVTVDEKLEGESAITEGEWADVTAILVGVYKRRAFGEWRREERAMGVTLRPELFTRPDDGPRPVTGDDPMRWRVDESEHRQWERTLETRVEQRDAIDVQIREAIEAAESESLPPLRDALLELSETDGEDASFDETAEWARERLLIDVEAGTCKETTRVDQAIESLQTLASALDLGRSDTGLADLGLELTDEHFESRWEWLGAYAEWKAAMGVYLYPENVLLPTLRRQQTPQFERIAESLTDGRRLSEADATAAAEAYSEYFEALCGLVPEAACLAEDPTRTDRGRPVYRAHVFAESTASDQVYHRSFDPTEATPAAADDFWDTISVLEARESDDTIVGAVTYESEIYLFLESTEDGEKTLGYVRYDVESDDWSEFEAIELPEIDDGEQEALLGVEIVQTEGTTRPPEFVIQRSYTMGDGDTTYNMTLYGAFTDAGTPPDPDDFGGVAVPAFEGSRQMPLEAAVRHGNHVYVLVVYWFGDDYNRRCLKYDPDEEDVTTYRSYDIGRRRIDKDAICLSPGSDRIFLVDSRFGNVDTIRLGGNFDIEEASHDYRGFPSQTTNEYVHCNNPVTELARGPETAFLDCVFIRRGVWHQNPRRQPDDWPYNTYLQSVRLEVAPGDADFDYDRRVVGIAPVVKSVRRFSFGVDSLEATDAIESVRHTSWMMLERHQPPHMRSNVPYVAEAFFHVPLLVARQLTQAGNFEAALEWFRTIYDYTRVDVEAAQVWYGLVQEREADSERNGTRVQRVASGVDWLDDPMDPHSMARDRSYPYTQFTLFSIAQCLLGYADEEFTRGTAGSVARARSLYELTLDLFEALADELEPDDPEADDRERLGVGTTRLARESEDRSAADRTGPEAGTDRRLPTRRNLHASLLADRNAVRSLREMDGVAAESAPRAALDGGVPVSDERVSRSTGSDSRIEALAGFDTLRVQSGFCVQPNPYLRSLRSHASANLEKIRRCRTIAGLEREQRPSATSGGVEDVVPTPGSDGQISVPTPSIQPTNYRYDTLVARAKELVNLARQIESEFLQALERRDQEAFRITQARQNIERARAGVRLQGIRLEEVQSALELTELELDRTELRVDHYTSLLEERRLEVEEEALRYMQLASGLHLMATTIHGFRVAQEGIKAGVTGGLFGDPTGAMAAMASSGAAFSSAQASWLSTIASYKRREQRWKHQKRLAEQDVRIGRQQIEVARDRVDVVEQERAIAELETTHAEDVATFHETKFTNRELYQWMSGILERVYRYFLQQATSMAKLAESQLAFERQEPTPDIVGSGYWNVDRSNRGARLDGDADDRRGLTGSARLLEDIYQLDQHEFTTDERKLQVEKTISLAQFDPVALQQFRETGVLQFGTPLELFDRDHPGHYLRLIKSVDVSVIALTPPTDGIKATLTASGISRVVAGDHIFRKRVIRRQPESIVLRASQRGENVFDLQPEEQEMLRPFENMGVETSWELRMPKAANQFDYESIADVLLTIEYTALDSHDYRQQVTAELDSRDSLDRAFSFEDEFADQWYDLHNPDQTAEPMTVHFETERDMLPPNLSELEIEGVQLYFFGVENELEGLDFSLTFTEQGASGSAGGKATPIDGVIRTPTASTWNAIRGKTPTGEWTLSLPDTPAVRELFSEDTIENMLFVVTVSGERPDWPE